MHQVQSFPMRRSGFFFVLLCIAVVSFAAETADPFVGRWVGIIHRADEPLEVEVDLWRTHEGRWRGDMSIPSQGAKDLPMEVDVTGSQIMFRVLNIPGEPWFLGKVEGDTIEGEFKAATPYALTLMRAVVDEEPSK